MPRRRRTPETVTVLRGPAGEGGPPAFAVVDSHPRPGLEVRGGRVWWCMRALTGLCRSPAQGAHMLVYPSLDAAAARLHEVFPSLGGSDGTSECRGCWLQATAAVLTGSGAEAATMYNAFNATAIGREGSARGEPRALGEGGAAGEA